MAKIFSRLECHFVLLIVSSALKKRFSLMQYQLCRGRGPRVSPSQCARAGSTNPMCRRVGLLGAGSTPTRWRRPVGYGCIRLLTGNDGSCASSPRTEATQLRLSERLFPHMSLGPLHRRPGECLQASESACGLDQRASGFPAAFPGPRDRRTGLAAEFRCQVLWELLFPA